MGNTDLVFSIAIGAVFYSILNLYIRSTIVCPDHLTTSQKQDFIGRHVSLFHSVESIVLCIISYVYSNGIDFFGDTDSIQVITLGVSLGYFLYDGIYAEIFSLHDWLMRIHHICVLIGGVALLTQAKGGAIGPVCLLLTELSNPFLQYRLILKDKHMENTEIYKKLQLTFGLIFIAVRGFIGTVINYNVHQYPLPWLLKLMVSGVYSVSLFWIYVIFNMFSKDFKANKELTTVQKVILSTIGKLKENQISMVCGIAIWALFLPSLCSAFKLPPVHLVVNSFKVI